MRSLKNLGGRVVPGGFRFHQPDETRTFSRLKDLVDFVAEYRNSNHRNGEPDVDLAELQAEIEDWMCGVMGSREYYCLEEGRAMAPADHTGEKYVGNGYQGQVKWKELHEWARDTQQSASERQDWLDTFASSLPCGECRRGWRALVRENPAPLEGSIFDLFRWSFDQHNAIRKKLGQTEFGFDEAVSLYGTSPEE